MFFLCKNIYNCKFVFNIIIVIHSLFYIRLNNFDIKKSVFALNFVSSLVIALEVITKVISLKTGHSNASGPALIGQELDDKHTSRSRQARFKLSNIFQVFIQSIASIIVTHITVILFGAYPVKNFEETLSFSCLVASLVFIRPLICFGPTAIVNISQDWNWSNCSQVQGSFILLGSWLGAFLIPLDWDTPWQVWPLTCSIGALLGELTASFITLYDRSRKLKKAA